MHLSSIHIYPIKALRGISLQSAKVLPRGLQYDRRWLLVDENNRYMTQREFRQLALIDVALAETGLVVSKGGESIEVPFDPGSTEMVRITIFDDVCDALVMDHSINDWFSKVLDSKCKLVFMPETFYRPVDPLYDKGKSFVSFADAYPFLLIGEASLADLNSRLDEPVPMKRFRPNFVIDTSIPFEEDTWKEIKIGGVVFQLVKPCGRCIVTTVDPETAVMGKEPLRTLSTYRTVGNKVNFGQNLLFVGSEGLVKVGDEISAVV